jgi:Na+/H+ antiporter NhaB
MIIKRINQIPLAPLIILALALGLAPFVPEPHLQEKIRKLFMGTLHSPLDVFDLMMHGLPVLLLALRLVTGLFFKKNG